MLSPEHPCLKEYSNEDNNSSLFSMVVLIPLSFFLMYLRLLFCFICTYGCLNPCFQGCRNNVATGRRRWPKQTLETVDNMSYFAGLPRLQCGNHYGYTTHQDQTCKLRHGLINMIQRMQFHGLPSEHVVHLNKFFKLTDTVKSSANAPDYIKLVGFTFSLAGKTEDWFSDLLSQSITTWDQCSLAFLKKLFPVAKFEQLIRDIGDFAQFEQESFSKAQEQFKGLQRSYSHHGYPPQRLAHIFYGGLSQNK